MSVVQPKASFAFPYHVNNPRVTEAHNSRELSPGHLLPEEHHLGNVAVIEGRESLKATYDRKMELRSGRARATPGYTPLFEGVLNLPRPEGNLDEYKHNVAEIVKTFASRYEQMTGHKVLRADIHLDEGHIKDDIVIYNAHAHIVIDRTMDNGRTVQIPKGMFPKLQDLAAEVSGLERGRSAKETGLRHLSHQRYRALARDGRLITQANEQDRKDAMERLRRERDEARSEVTRVKGEAADLYRQLRAVMTEVGRIVRELPEASQLRATQGEYREAKKHSTDHVWLAEEIDEWRQRLKTAEDVMRAGMDPEPVATEGTDRSSKGGAKDANQGEDFTQTALNARTLYGELRGLMKGSGIAKQTDYQNAKRHAQDAQWLTAELKRWRELAELREQADPVEAAHERGRSGFSGDDRQNGRWIVKPFTREWDDHRRCAVYRARDGHEVFIATRRRVEVIDTSDESMAAALKVASKKFPDGITITGPTEFRNRAARAAARLGIKVLDADLAAVVREAQQHQGSQLPKRGRPPISFDPDR